MSERLSRISGLILTVYLCVLIVVISFYVPNGYAGLGEAKFVAFRGVCAIFFCMLLPVACLRLAAWITGGGSMRHVGCGERLIASLSVCLIVSFFMARDKGIALWGLEGWRFGVLTQLLIIFFAFMIWLQAEYIDLRIVGTVALITAGLVFLAGALNRFSIYPMSFMSESGSYLSTIGNINWYSAYVAVFLPLIAGYFLTCDRAGWPCLCVLGVGLFTAITQGSNTLALSVAAVIPVVLSGLLMRIVMAERVLLLTAMWGACMELYGHIVTIDSRRETFGTENIWREASQGHVGLILLVISVAVLLILRHRRVPEGFDQRFPNDRARRAGCVMLLISVWILLLLVASVVLIMVFHDKSGTIRHFLKDVFDIRLKLGWGNDRGHIWEMSGELFMAQRPFRMLFGLGPDCFADALYTSGTLSVRAYEVFGNARLTNAHNELFTALLDEGALYTIMLLSLYIRIYISLARRLVGTGPVPGRGEGAALCGLMLMASVIAHQFLTFHTISSTPFFAYFLAVCARDACNIAPKQI